MKPNIYWRSTIRRPLKSLLLLFFIGVVSFVFISRITEYIIVDRETKRIGSYYRSVGSLTPLNLGQGDVTLGAELISKSSYIDFEDRRRVSAGILKDLDNGSWEGYFLPQELRNRDILSPSNIWFYGTLLKKEFNPILGREAGRSLGGYILSVKIDQVELGYPTYIADGITIPLKFILEMRGDAAIIDGLEEGQRYFFRGYYDSEFDFNSRIYPRHYLFLKPIDEDSLWFVPVEPGETVDFSHPSLKEVPNIMAINSQNQRSMLIYTSKDMTIMPNVQEDVRFYYLTDGRWINYDDHLQENKVCVLSSRFAKMKGLSVGDTITLTLRELKTDYYYLVTEEDEMEWSNYPSTEVTFEIVGLYGVKNDSMAFLSTWIYIPEFAMPESFYLHEDTIIYSDSYNFVLKSSMDQKAFLNEYEDKLYNLGLRVSFLDKDTDTYWSSVLPIKQSAFVNAGIFTLVLTLVLIMIALINFYQRRKEFAIQRALGIPKHKAVFHFLVPMAIIGILGICLGGIFSWEFTLDKAAKTLKAIQGPKGTNAFSHLPVTWLILLCGVSFLIFMLFTAISAWILAYRPVLELLQGVSKIGRKKRIETTTLSKKEIHVHKNKIPKKPLAQTTAAKVQSNASPVDYKPISIGTTHKGQCFLASIRFILRHIRRSMIKSASTLLIALCFLLALGWINQKIVHDKKEIEHHYNNTVVEGEIVSGLFAMSEGFIYKSTIERVISNSFIEDHYLEMQFSRSFLAPKTTTGYDKQQQIHNIRLYAFSTPETFFLNAGKNIVPEYAAGYDETLFTKNWEQELAKEDGQIPVLLPTFAIEQMGISLGDNIIIPSGGEGRTRMFSCVIAGQYEGGFSESVVVFLPISALERMEQLAGKSLAYSAAQFKINPAKNKELAAFREEMEALVTIKRAGVIDLKFILWDGELQQVIVPLDKNLQLMTILYPITLILSVIIAAGISMFLVLQNAREAAIMRVLGINRRWASAMLSVEQILVSLSGLTIGFITLLLLQDKTAESLTSIYLICGGLYLAGSSIGAIITANLVTNRMPLDLLQVKE